MSNKTASKSPIIGCSKRAERAPHDLTLGSVLSAIRCLSHTPASDESKRAHRVIDEI